MMHITAFSFAAQKFIMNIVVYTRSPVFMYPSKDLFTSFNAPIILTLPAFQAIITEQTVILNSDFTLHLFLYYLLLF
jgi:hypothetical protein